MARRELWEMIGRGELEVRGGGGGVWGRCKQYIKHLFLIYSCFLRGFLYWKNHEKKKNGQVLNKPQMRLLLKISRGTFYQIQIYIYIYIYTRVQKGWHFRNIYKYIYLLFFLLFRPKKQKIYIYLKCQPFWKRTEIFSNSLIWGLFSS